jgi:hypothetical protein
MNDSTAHGQAALRRVESFASNVSALDTEPPPLTADDTVEFTGLAQTLGQP